MPVEVTAEVESVFVVANSGAADATEEDVMPPIDTSAVEETLAVVATAAVDEVVVPTTLAVVDTLPAVDGIDERPLITSEGPVDVDEPVVVAAVGDTTTAEVVSTGLLLPLALPVPTRADVALLTTLRIPTDDDVEATVMAPVDVVAIAGTIVPASRSVVVDEPLLPVASGTDVALLMTSRGPTDDDVVVADAVAPVDAVAIAGTIVPASRSVVVDEPPLLTVASGTDVALLMTPRGPTDDDVVIADAVAPVDAVAIAGTIVPASRSVVVNEPLLPVASETDVALLTTLRVVGGDDDVVVADGVAPVDAVAIVGTIVPASRSVVVDEPLLPVASGADVALLTTLRGVGGDDNVVVAPVDVVTTAGVISTAVVILATLPVAVDELPAAGMAVVEPVTNTVGPVEDVPTAAGVVSTTGLDGVPVLRNDEVTPPMKFEEPADVVVATVVAPVGVLAPPTSTRLEVVALTRSAVTIPLIVDSWREAGRVFDESGAVLVRPGMVGSIVAGLLPLATLALAGKLGDDKAGTMADEGAPPVADPPPVAKTTVDVEALPPDAPVTLEGAIQAAEGAVVFDDSVSPRNVRGAEISTLPDEIDVEKERS